MFLFERIETLKQLAPQAWAELPREVAENLHPGRPLRDYQTAALRNFATYFENENLRRWPAHVLFHMATGSGKTLVMAALILYLYRKGHRNFLFFVNLDNIVRKTEANFLDVASGKFLFAPQIRMDGETVRVRRVENFQGADPDAANICFTTVQGLHHDMWFHKEGAPTFEDFDGTPVVLLADEAHHLSADTRRGGRGGDPTVASWQETVERILAARPDNVLLEFTATCNLRDEAIRARYEDKIVFDYPLAKFREERWSKEVAAVRADFGSRAERALLALLFSQWRLKVFADHRQDVKPVVLFKSKTIAESRAFVAEFESFVAKLSGTEVAAALARRDIGAGGGPGSVAEMADYFAAKGLSPDDLARELRDAFSPPHCISANDEGEADERQILLNSLESPANPYRAVFEVKKLDEGWDVLNLFDIVRLYETRDAGKGKVGKDTTAEAQLVGRGARYWPFATAEGQERDRRKFDGDASNPLRVCETLLYHCQFDPKYFTELRTALAESGIVAKSRTEVRYRLKDAFKASDFYKYGVVFANRRVPKAPESATGLPASLRSRAVALRFEPRRSAVGGMLGGGDAAESAGATWPHTFSLADSEAEGWYPILLKASREFPALRFDRLKERWPALDSMRRFLVGEDWCGGIRVEVESGRPDRGAEETLAGCRAALRGVADYAARLRESWDGSRDFDDRPVREVFTDKTRLLADVKDAGEGRSQNDPGLPVDLRLDLSDKDWYVYNDNFGTTEEKAFVRFFALNLLPEYKKRYDDIRLVRNERQLPLYSFDGGERFEPDFVLFLRRRKSDKWETRQIFVEPKGTHLLKEDAWKESFLADIEGKAVAKPKWAEHKDTIIVGLPFFNRDERPGFKKAAEKAGAAFPAGDSACFDESTEYDAISGLQTSSLAAQEPSARSGGDAPPPSPSVEYPKR